MPKANSLRDWYSPAIYFLKEYKLKELQEFNECDTPYLLEEDKEKK